MFGQKNSQSDSRKIVIRQRWMADMGRDQYLILSLPFEKIFAVGKIAVAQSGVDADFVFTLRERCEYLVAQAEAPVLFIIGSAVGNPIRVLRHCERVGFQFLKGNLLMDR